MHRSLFDLNGASRFPGRAAIFADEMVVSSQPLAAQIGLEQLARGGNAVDAALAAAISLTVLEPTSNGIGSDLYAIVWHADELHGLNASGRSPQALSLNQFEGQTAPPIEGWDAVVVPGAVSGWQQLSQRFSKFDLGVLCEPAVRLAAKGFPVTPGVAAAWARGAERFQKYEGFSETFLFDGHAPHPGQRVQLPDHAATLASIGSEGADAFYQGNIAEEIVAQARGAGSVLCMEDLANHTPIWVDPLSTKIWGGATLHELPPNGQGIAALIGCGVLAQGPDQNQMSIVQNLHYQIEAVKMGLATAQRVVADPDHVREDMNALISNDALTSKANEIDPTVAGDYGPLVQPHGGTVYVTAADSQGMMVSLIQSNFMGFGSGIVVRGTGVAMNNRVAGFMLDPSHPNALAGGKRPLHTILPGLVTRNDEHGNRQPLITFGVVGGHMQPQGHVQLLDHLLRQRQDPQSSLDAPRFRVLRDRIVEMEPGFDAKTYEGLKDLGHDVKMASEPSPYFGGGQIIAVDQSGYIAGSDARQDGQAAGRSSSGV
ncbi:MAG: gamma-glutamyltransferase family protein [Phycisphaerales bacterium]|nr:gamma-glutamyltransferase family protein [Phycisphaerales bacterium]